MRNILTILILLFVFSSALKAQQSVGLFYNDPGSLQGYTLISPMTSNFVFLLDNCGELVHSWETDARPGLMVYLDDEGNLYRAERTSVVFGGGGAGGRISKYSWEGALLWQYDYTGEFQTAHHDIALLPSGNILVLSWDRYTHEEAVAMGRPADVVGDYLWSEKVVELKPIGTNDAEEVWVWKLWDHLIQDMNPSLPNYGVVADHPERMNINFNGTESLPTSAHPDWMHFNGIDYNEELDQILLSARGANEILILDHSVPAEETAGSTGGNSGKGGDIIYRWGNPISYNTGTIDNRQFFGQHNATWLKWGENEDWAILVYNNGVGRPDMDYSQVDIIIPPVSGFNYVKDANKPYNPGAPIWTLEEIEGKSFFSSNVSGAQYLENGKVLVCVGGNGSLFEIDIESKNSHWKYISPAQNDTVITQGLIATQNNLFRGTRYSMDFPGFVGKDLTPQGPLEVNPLPSDCEIISGLNDISEPATLHIFPNPTTGIITISDIQYSDKVEFFDRLGKRVESLPEVSSGQFDLSHLANGIYFIRLNEGLTQRIVLLR